EKDSAAAKAGVKPHDILLEFAGKPVPSDVDSFRKILDDVKAKTEVDVVVLRKGKRETLKGLTLPEKTERPDNNPFNFRPAPGVFDPPPAQGSFGPAFGVAFANGPNGGITTTFRNNDRFTTRHQEGSLVITVTGTVADGKTKVSEIQVQDGNESHKYDSAD